jgi:hypothetical protein
MAPLRLLAAAPSTSGGEDHRETARAAASYHPSHRSQRGAASNSIARCTTSLADAGSRGEVVTVNGQPPMVDEQAIIVFLRQLDRALAAASRGDEQQRLHRLALTQSLVMAVLADPRHLDRALRQAADGLAHLAA